MEEKFWECTDYWCGYMVEAQKQPSECPKCGKEMQETDNPGFFGQQRDFLDS